MSGNSVMTVLGFAAVVIIAGGLIFTCADNGYRKCLDTARNKPCIEGTVRYDMDCECTTRHGELKWNIYPGCDMD